MTKGSEGQGRQGEQQGCASVGSSRGGGSTPGVPVGTPACRLTVSAIHYLHEPQQGCAPDHRPKIPEKMNSVLFPAVGIEIGPRTRGRSATPTVTFRPIRRAGAEPCHASPGNLWGPPCPAM